MMVFKFHITSNIYHKTNPMTHSSQKIACFTMRECAQCKYLMKMASFVAPASHENVV